MDGIRISLHFRRHNRARNIGLGYLANHHPGAFLQQGFVNGQWRCWFDFGMGALGDWGAHLLDTAHQFLNLGLPYEIDPLKADGTIIFSIQCQPPCLLNFLNGVPCRRWK